MKEKVLINMDKEDAKRHIANKVYQASFLYERLEGVGKIRGNGHHIMQELCKHAESLVEKYWVE